MPKKPKFKPKIIHVKLNPEQAVLACVCFNGTYVYDAFGGNVATACQGRTLQTIIAKGFNQNLALS